MSELPEVRIEILNGQLGRVGGSDDGIMGLVLSGIAAAGLALNTPKAIFSLADAEALGIDAAYDTANTLRVYEQIKDFYTTALTGTQLWIMIIPQTTTMTVACDKANDIVRKMLNAADGLIKMWGIVRKPDAGYTPTYSGQYDSDSLSAILKAHELSQEFSAEHAPVRCVIPLLDWQGDVGTTEDFRTYSQNTVHPFMGSIHAHGEPSIGFTLGQYANRPVQRKISRTKDGNLGLVEGGFMSNGTATETYKDSWKALADKAIGFFRKFNGKSNYYFSKDGSASPLTDDYALISRGRVIDKAHRIVYTTMVDELEDDLFIAEDGTVNPAEIKNYQEKVRQQLEGQMAGEISRAEVTITPVQNLLATDMIQFTKVGVIPKGYSSIIDIPLGFTNPLNA